MSGRRRRDGVGITVPAEEGAKREVLHYGELGQYFRVVHFDHTLDNKQLVISGKRNKTNLIDFPPSSLNAGNVVEHRAVFPKWPFLDVVNEANRGEIHIRQPFSFDNMCFGNAIGRWSTWKRALFRSWICF